MLRRKTKRRLLIAAALVVAVPVLLANVASYHIKRFPLVLESAVRHYSLSTYAIRPAVVDAWGGLLTRVLPLDDNHLVAGKSTSVIFLRRQGERLEQCAEIVGIGSVHDFALRGHVLYAANGAENLAWYDVQDPCAPKFLGRRMFRGYGFGIAIDSDRLFLANRQGGLTVFRLASDGTPVFDRDRFGRAQSGLGGVSVFLVLPLLSALHLTGGPENPERVGWMTNDVALLGDGLAAADANKGVLLFDKDGPVDQGIQALLTDRLVRPSVMRNIDPPPVRIKCDDRFVFLAMRDQGLAVLARTAQGALEFVAMLRPDDGEVLDIALAAGRLYVPSTSGRVYVYETAAGAKWDAPLALRYELGEGKPIHSLAVQPPYLYASAVGAGLYVFDLASGAPVTRWRTPDEFRSVARVGDCFVAALGGGGLGVFQVDGDSWRLLAREELPSFAFDVVSLGADRFAVCADVAGAWIFRLDEAGRPVLLTKLPTPEHSFAAAFAPPGTLATANGVLGVIRYDLQFSEDGKVTAAEGGHWAPTIGYAMRVVNWRGEIIGENYATQLILADAPRMAAEKDLPWFCFNGAVSRDGATMALACLGNEVTVFSADGAGPLGRSKAVHDREVISLLPAPPHLLVGGFPNGVAVYRQAGKRFRREVRFATAGTPYDMFQDGDSFWIAAGRDGVYRVSREAGTWRLQKAQIQW